MFLRKEYRLINKQVGIPFGKRLKSRLFPKQEYRAREGERKRKKMDKRPFCKYCHWECTAYRKGYCIALNDVNFEKRFDCPFHKSTLPPPEKVDPRIRTDNIRVTIYEK